MESLPPGLLQAAPFLRDYQPLGNSHSLRSVYHGTAAQKQTGKKVKVKTFLLAGLWPQELAKLEDEVESQSLMDHPNVAKVQAIYRSRKNIRMVTDYFEGSRVSEVFKEEGIPPESQAALVIGQLLQAVEHMHSLGVVHRNIKLSSLIYESGKRDRVKLVDFSRSTFWVDSMAPMDVGCISSICMAPEVIRGSYTTSVDLWCVGVVAHKLLTGTDPDMDMQCTPILSQRLSMCSEGAQKFVASLLTSDPTIRPSATEALGHDWIQPMTSQGGMHSCRSLQLSTDTGPRSQVDVPGLYAQYHAEWRRHVVEEQHAPYRRMPCFSRVASSVWAAVCGRGGAAPVLPQPEEVVPAWRAACEDPAPEPLP